MTNASLFDLLSVVNNISSTEEEERDGEEILHKIIGNKSRGDINNSVLLIINGAGLVKNVPLSK